VSLEGRVKAALAEKGLDREGVSSFVVALTDATFEARTQAGGGQTAGAWFVEFYAPWCGHCKKLAPVWEELAMATHGELAVASVDATVHKATAERLGVRAYPTLILFRDGQMVRYKGPRTVEALRTFAVEDGWRTAEGEPVPRVPSRMDAAVLALRRGIQVLSLVKDLRMIVDKMPLAGGAIYVGGLLTGVALGIVSGRLMYGRRRRAGAGSPPAPLAGGAATAKKTQ